MSHKFDIKNKSKLDNEKRRQILPAHQTLEILGFTNGIDMADIGCGIGYFSIPAAEIAGSKSKIYALDISVEMLEDVKKRALGVGVSNIQTIQVEGYDLKLGSQSVGFALLSIVLHEIDDKKIYVDQINRILKSGGKLAIIEWEKINEESGPPIGDRISYEEIAVLLSDSGFVNILKLSIGQNLYGVTAIKK